MLSANTFQGCDEEREVFSLWAYDPSGAFVGAGEQKRGELSAKWLAIAQDFFLEFGTDFEASLGGPLSCLTTKFTADDGAALLSIYVNNVLAVCAVLLSGLAPSKEAQLLKMFVRSMSQTDVAAVYEGSADRFGRMLEIPVRPLMIVVPSGDGRLTDQDEDLVKEWAMHLAGVFLFQQSETSFYRL